MSEALFRLEGGRYVPTDRSRGPWSPEALHGSPVAALLAHVVEERRSAELELARLTVDLCRPVPYAPLSVAVEPVREGRRVALYRLAIEADGRALTYATALCLRRNAPSEGDGAQYDPLPSPPSADALPGGVLDRRGNPWVSYPGTLEMRFHRAPGGAEPAEVWIRADARVLEGVEATPAVRAASIADFVSPFANMGDGASPYVNADITLQLQRPPRGEWLCLSVMTRGAREGVAVAQAVLRDVEGSFGAAAATSIYNGG